MMALTAGMIIPNVLRWYWWRLNGWGYAAGIAGGMALSIFSAFHARRSHLPIVPRRSAWGHSSAAWS